MSGVANSPVMYSSCCTLGEIIALLYNHVAQEKSKAAITPEVAEELVHKKLGDARTLGGRSVPSQEGYLDEINGVPLSVWCYPGAIDVSGYPHGDGRALTDLFIDKRKSDLAKLSAQTVKWETI